MSKVNVFRNYDFGVLDAKGRRVGCRIYVLDDGVRWEPSNIRDGKDYGPMQGSRPVVSRDFESDIMRFTNASFRRFQAMAKKGKNGFSLDPIKELRGSVVL